MTSIRSAQLPPDAIQLSESQAAGYAWSLVWGWSSRSDTWALRYGPGLLGGLSGLSGLVVNSHYRTRLRLGRYGQFSSLLPVVFLPGIFTAFFHRQAVSTDIVLGKNACFLCYEIRAAVFQGGFGITYPMILGPIATLMLANRYSTYRLPSMIQEPKEWLAFIVKISKSLASTLTVLSVVHFTAATGITYYEVQNYLAIQKKIKQVESKIEELL